MPYVHDCNTILLANHGTVTFGPTLENAYFNTEIIDAYCKILILARQLGKVNYFSEEQTKELMAFKKRLGYDDVRFKNPDCTALCSALSTFNGPEGSLRGWEHARLRPGRRPPVVPHRPAATARCRTRTTLVRMITDQVMSALPAGAGESCDLYMLDPRSTKSGFVTAVIAAAFLVGTAVATGVVYLLWWAAGWGAWAEYSWSRDVTLRIIWGCCIVAFAATLLTRVTIIGWYFRRYFRPSEEAVPPPEPIGAGPRRPTTAPWYKSGALSFSMTVTLVALAGTTAVASVVVWVLGDFFGDWLMWVILKTIWGVFWIVCIAVVLTRIGVFRLHMLKAKPPEPPAAEAPQQRPPESPERSSDQPLWNEGVFRMKVSIIGGGGLVGSMTAYALQCGGVVSSLCVIDANKDMAPGAWRPTCSTGPASCPATSASRPATTTTSPPTTSWLSRPACASQTGREPARPHQPQRRSFWAFSTRSRRPA